MINKVLEKNEDLTRKAREAFARKSVTHTEIIIERFLIAYELLVEAVSEAKVQGRDVDGDKFEKLLEEFETIGDGEDVDMTIIDLQQEAELSEKINTRSARLRNLMDESGGKILTLPRRVVTGTEVTTEGVSQKSDDEEEQLDDDYL